MKKSEISFQGPFRELIPDFLKWREAAGYKNGRQIAYQMRAMDRLFMDMGICEPKITREMYEAWLSFRPEEKESNREARRGYLIAFAKYLISLGFQDIYAGQDDKKVYHRDFIPYIFSKEEICSIFQISRKHIKKDPSYDNASFCLLLELYYCCGLRKSEATGLRIRDVDFDKGELQILHGKNDVSRIVVVSESLKSELKEYHKTYLHTAMPDDFLIHGIKVPHYSNVTLYKKFHKLLDEAGIQKRADGRYPRIHDLRHTFCVHALAQMEEKGFDTYTALPLLSVYLGHKNIQDTEYYLRLTETYMEEILEKTENYSPGLFPKLGKGDS